ncbi:Zinc finger protein 541, partial [Balearica regulorum gibbericeps]
LQGGNIYSLTKAAKEENPSAERSKTGAAPTDGSSSESGFLHQNCGQPVYTENGLESRECFRGEQWHPLQRKEEQQVKGNGIPRGFNRNLNAQRLWVGADRNHASEPEAPLVTVVPLVIPVSVPVTDSQGGNEASPVEKDLKEASHQKKRKKQTRPKSLFIPPPPGLDAQPGLGGCYQSNLRSPVFLVDHLLRDLFQRSYTPPPMLSPVREGSGLYFSTLCSPSASGDPSQLFGAILGRMDKDFGFCVKDNADISVEPHINVGSQFQAELPNLQDRSQLENEDEGASLVWKPWGDIATNPETQDRVTELLNTACSSIMPGGGTNIEFALHCLHEARGNTVEALEMMLLGMPQKSESHPLANYHYTGSDSWTPLEKQLFKKAFRLHKKDFYLIHKQIQTKSVAQCVEYYYIWKKKPKFDYNRAQVIGKKVKRAKDEVEETGEKVEKLLGICARNNEARFNGVYRIEKGIKNQNQIPVCVLPSRVFDTIKGRNAHMKRHRPQEQAEPL